MEISFDKISPILTSRTTYQIEDDVDRRICLAPTTQKSSARTDRIQVTNKIEVETKRPRRLRKLKTQPANSESKTMAGFLSSIGFSPAAKGVSWTGGNCCYENEEVKGGGELSNFIVERKFQGFFKKNSSLKLELEASDYTRSSTQKDIIIYDQQKFGYFTPKSRRINEENVQNCVDKNEGCATARDLVSKQQQLKKVIASFSGTLTARKSSLCELVHTKPVTPNRNRFNKIKSMKESIQKKQSIPNIHLLKTVVSTYGGGLDKEPRKTGAAEIRPFQDIYSIRRLSTIDAASLATLSLKPSESTTISQGSLQRHSFGRSLTDLFRKTASG